MAVGSQVRTLSPIPPTLRTKGLLSDNEVHATARAGGTAKTAPIQVPPAWAWTAPSTGQRHGVTWHPVPMPVEYEEVWSDVESIGALEASRRQEEEEEEEEEAQWWQRREQHVACPQVPFGYSG